MEERNVGQKVEKGTVPKPKTGPESMAAIGMPREFGAQLMLLAEQFGVTIAIRASMPEQKYRDAAQPKPSDVKAKTGDWGLTKGVIAEDPELGKHNAQGQPINSGMKHSDRVTTTLHRISLRNILHGLNSIPPTMELINPDKKMSLQENIASNKYLLIRCLDAPADKRDYVYKVDFSEGMKPIQIDTQHIKVLRDSSPTEPDWWSPVLGGFSEMLEMRLPVECRKSIEQPFVLVKVLAILNEKKALLPITGDMDLLWISRPSEAHPFIKQALQQSIPLLTVMDLSKPENIDNMRAYLQALCKLQDADQIKFNLITDDKLARMGCITPFEAYMIIIINQRFADFVDHLDDLLQHGCENRNPGKASDLDSGVLHCTNGLFTLTTSELELINYILDTPSFLTNFVIEPNNSWDMSKEKWGRVVDRMLELRQNVDPKVLGKHYSTSSALRKLSITFKGFGRSLSNPDNLTSPHSPPLRSVRKHSVQSFLVQIICPEFKEWNDQQSLLGTQSKRLLQELCRKQSEQGDGETWELLDKNTLVITSTNADGGSQTHQFKIDANSISLIAAVLDDKGIAIFKILREVLLQNKDIVINSLVEANKLLLEHHLSPQSGLRPNSNHQ